MNQLNPREKKNMRSRILIVVREGLIFCALALLILHCVGEWRAPDLPANAPDFSLTTIDGRTVRLSDLKGQAVVLNFWATWCWPCRMEIPSFSSFADAHPHIKVLGIAVDGSPAQLREKAKEWSIRYPVLIGSNDVQRTYGVSTLPTTIIVDPLGRIHKAHTGIMFGPQLDWATRHFE